MSYVEKVSDQVKENLLPPLQNMQQTSQIMMQNTQNQLVGNMLNAMEAEMKKIREMLNVI